MKIIKLALISFIVFFGIATAFSLMIPSSIRLSKAVNVKAEPARILSFIKDTSQWREWWPSLNSKASFNLNLRPLRQNDSEVVWQLQQADRRPVTSGWQIHQLPSGDSLALQWYMDFHLPWYPWQKFSTLFYESTYGTMMQQGLENIKGLAEK
jgi:Polyketide cyclase / dehydrase and lipid transport